MLAEYLIARVVGVTRLVSGAHSGADRLVSIYSCQLASNSTAEYSGACGSHLNCSRLITSKVSSSSDLLTRMRLATIPKVTATKEAFSSTVPTTSDCR